MDQSSKHRLNSSQQTLNQNQNQAKPHLSSSLNSSPVRGAHKNASPARSPVSKDHSDKLPSNVDGCEIRIASDIKKSIDIVLKELDLSKINQSTTKKPFQYSARGPPPMSVGSHKQFKFELTPTARKFLNSPSSRGNLQWEGVNRDNMALSHRLLNKQATIGPERRTPAVVKEEKPELSLKRSQSFDDGSKEVSIEVEEGVPLNERSSDKVVKLPLLREVPEEIIVPIVKPNDNPYSIKITLGSQNSGPKLQGKVKQVYISPPRDKSSTTERTLAIESKDQDSVNNSNMETPKQNWLAKGLGRNGNGEKNKGLNMDNMDTPKQVGTKGFVVVRRSNVRKEAEEEGENEEFIKDASDAQMLRKWTNFSLPSDDGTLGKIELQKEGSAQEPGNNRGYCIDIPAKGEDLNLSSPRISWSLIRGPPRISMRTVESDNTLILDSDDLGLDLLDETEKLRYQVAARDSQIRELVEIFNNLEKTLGDMKNSKHVGTDKLEEAAVSLRENVSQVLKNKDF